VSESDQAARARIDALLAAFLASHFERVAVSRAVRDDVGSVVDFELQYVQVGRGLIEERLRGVRESVLNPEAHTDGTHALAVQVLETGRASSSSVSWFAHPDGLVALRWRAERLDDHHLLVLFDDVTTGEEAPVGTGAASGLLESVVEAGNDVWLVLDEGAEPLFLSPNFRRITGWRLADVVAQTPQGLTHPEDLPTVVASTQAVLRDGGRVGPQVTRLRRVDGSYLWLEWTITDVRDRPGLGAVLVQGHDVSDRVEAEDRLRHTLDAMPVPVALLAADGTPWVNRAFMDFTGTAERRAGPECWHPDDRAIAIRGVQAVAASGTPVSAETRLRRADGVYRAMLVTLAPAGPLTPGLFVGTAVDVDDLRQAQTREQAVDELLRASIESLLDGFAIVAVRDDGALPVTYFKGTGGWPPIAPGDDMLGRVGEAVAGPMRAIIAEAQTTRRPVRRRITTLPSDIPADEVIDVQVAAMGSQVALSWHYVTVEVRRQEALASAERRLRSAFESIPIAQVFTDPTGRMKAVNPAFCELVGRPAEELLTMSLGELPPVAIAEVDRPESLARVNAGEELRVPRADGTTRWVIGRIVPINTPDGELHEYFASFVDITERRAAEQRFRELAETAPDIVFRVRMVPEPMVEYVSPALETVLGSRTEELMADPLLLWEAAHPDEAERLVGLSEGDEGPVSIRMRHRDGHWVWIEVRVRHERDENGRVMAFSGIARDVSSMKRAEEDLAFRATHDPLTGLPNRALFLEHLVRSLAQFLRYPDHRVAVLYLDLDRFKVVNDSLGHAIGDRLLVQVARRLSDALRPGDTLARLGGDEFTVVLDRLTNPQEALLIAERLKGVLALPFEVDGREVLAQVSIGVAFATQATWTPDDLLRHADAALARAKERGRNRIELFDDALRSELVERLDREVALRHGLERDEILVYYQPEVDLLTGEVLGVEALARWERPGRGLVLPGEFIPLAEETGLIVALGARTLRRVTEQLVTWERAGRAVDVKVNLSARQLASPDIVEQVARAVDAAGCDPSHLCLEVTESVLLGDLDDAVARLEALRAVGVRIALDDFGTGFSSLSYLHRLPLDLVKIDRAFVAELGTGPRNVAIARAIVEMAGALALDVVAEGVETEVQRNLLLELGCRRGQGWLFAPALPVEALEPLLGRPLGTRQLTPP